MLGSDIGYHPVLMMHMSRLCPVKIIAHPLRKGAACMAVSEWVCMTDDVIVYCTTTENTVISISHSCVIWQGIQGESPCDFTSQNAENRRSHNFSAFSMQDQF